MSGGVDSSTAAALLAREGHDVIGIGLKLPEPLVGRESDRSCCGIANMDDARRVSDEIGIPFYLLNYEKIFECNASDVVHQFDDITASRGFDYYYYIQSKDDGTNESGIPINSSLSITLTSVPGQLQRPAGTRLEQVRVVPNPYDIRSRMFQFGADAQYDRIAFYDIPAICKLRIFTERGDLIWEKDHTSSTGDEIWDSITSSGQIIVSGIYALYVEVTEDTYDTWDQKDGRLLYRKGESVFRKFVVIR